MKESKRKKIPKSQFGLPGSRRFPVDTKRRAVSAKAYAQKMYNQGKLSKSSRDKIRAKANKRLRRK